MHDHKKAFQIAFDKAKAQAPSGRWLISVSRPNTPATGQSLDIGAAVGGVPNAKVKVVTVSFAACNLTELKGKIKRWLAAN